jgi:hypothetical protein
MVKDDAFRQEIYSLQWSRKLMDLEDKTNGRK